MRCGDQLFLCSSGPDRHATKGQLTGEEHAGCVVGLGQVDTVLARASQALRWVSLCLCQTFAGHPFRGFSTEVRHRVRDAGVPVSCFPQRRETTPKTPSLPSVGGAQLRSHRPVLLHQVPLTQAQGHAPAIPDVIQEQSRTSTSCDTRQYIYIFCWTGSAL